MLKLFMLLICAFFFYSIVTSQPQPQPSAPSPLEPSAAPIIVPPTRTPLAPPTIPPVLPLPSLKPLQTLAPVPTIPLPPTQVPTPAIAKPVVPRRCIGLVASWDLSDEQLKELKPCSDRLLFLWSGMQPHPQAELTSHILPMVDRELRAGVEVTGLILQTPEWARANKADGVDSLPKNLQLPIEHNDNYYYQWVKKLTYDYRDRIDHWIIGNEHDMHHKPIRIDAKYYYQLLKTAYLAAKQGNPKAIVHIAGQMFWDDYNSHQPLFVERLLQLAHNDPTAKEHNYYFDVLNFHSYSNPNDIPLIASQYKAILQKYGLQKPLWVNEANSANWDDAVNKGAGTDTPTGMRCTQHDQARYVLQSAALAIASGVERFSLFPAVDFPAAAHNPNDDPIGRAGLVRRDGTTRPAYKAFQIATTYLTDPQSVKSGKTSSIQWVSMTIANPSRHVFVFWNAEGSPASAKLTAHGENGKLIHPDGREQTLTKRDNAYSLSLPGASCKSDEHNKAKFVIGGAVGIIVEDLP